MIGERTYDIVLCCGVLMYMNEHTANEVVRVMCSRAKRLVAIICLAQPEGHRVAIVRTAAALSDGAFIHDVERMIRRTGGHGRKLGTARD